MRLLHWLSELLFPGKCVLCGKILDKEETDLCRDCRLQTPECPISQEKFPYLDSWLALWFYEDNVRGSLLRYKFYGHRNYADAYGRMLAMKLLREERTDFDVLTWVPVSKKRRRKRGYDQVELLAKSVARELNVTPARLLCKVRDNPPQSGITGRAERKANVLGAYCVVSPDLVVGKKIMLLDDILTTGATAGECARTLLTAGAKEVHYAAVAAATHHE